MVDYLKNYDIHGVFFNGEEMQIRVSINYGIIRYEPHVTFTMFNSRYTYLVNNIDKRNIDAFMTKSITYYPNKFGTMDDEGNIHSSFEEYDNAIQQFVKDIFQTINRIYNKYNNSMGNYAKWYLNRYTNNFLPETYEEIVTVRACEIITKYFFYTPGTEWEMIEFQ